jgi:hypothetical protein
MLTLSQMTGMRSGDSMVVTSWQGMMLLGGAP